MDEWHSEMGAFCHITFRYPFLTGSPTRILVEIQ